MYHSVTAGLSLTNPLKKRRTKATDHMYILHRVHILVLEGNPISLVFQNIDPPHPPLRRCGGRTDSPGGEGDGGVNILEDERDRIALLE